MPVHPAKSAGYPTSAIGRVYADMTHTSPRSSTTCWRRKPYRCYRRGLSRIRACRAPVKAHRHSAEADETWFSALVATCDKLCPRPRRTRPGSKGLQLSPPLTRRRQPTEPNFWPDQISDRARRTLSDHEVADLKSIPAQEQVKALRFVAENGDVIIVAGREWLPMPAPKGLLVLARLAPIWSREPDDDVCGSGNDLGTGDREIYQALVS